MQSQISRPLSRKSGAVACLLCTLFGYLGIHRFYVGKIGTGILQLLTVGGLGIWYLIDLLMIAFGEFTDKEGLKLSGSSKKGCALILCYFLGVFGIHRFFLGRWVSGLVMLLTVGGLGIWWAIDLLLISCDQLTDASGTPLTPQLT
jgi:TM2 domain-containing membrane protein YozV